MEDLKNDINEAKEGDLFQKKDFENINLDTDPISAELKYEQRKAKTEANFGICFLTALVLHITFLSFYLYEHGPWSWKRFFIALIVTYCMLDFGTITLQAAVKRHYYNTIVERYFVQWLYTRKNILAYYKNGLRFKFEYEDEDFDCSIDEIMQSSFKGYYKHVIPWKPNCDLSEKQMVLSIKTKQSPFLIFNIQPVSPSMTPQHMEEREPDKDKADS